MNPSLSKKRRLCILLIHPIALAVVYYTKFKYIKYIIQKAMHLKRQLFSFIYLLQFNPIEKVHRRRGHTKTRHATQQRMQRTHLQTVGGTLYFCAGIYLGIFLYKKYTMYSRGATNIQLLLCIEPSFCRLAKYRILIHCTTKFLKAGEKK